MGVTEGSWRKMFTYGTLKKGFSNHRLMEELIEAGEARYIGSCQTEEKYPLVCGPYRVPFLLNLQGQGCPVEGEIYEVSQVALTRMDELEGISRGHYQRLPIRVLVNSSHIVDADAYFAHNSYAEDLWRKSGEKGYIVYSHKEAIGYVKRRDRPQHIPFLDQISIFLSSSP